MTKTVSNIRKRGAENAVFTKKAAELAGVSVNHAEKVLRADRRNEKVLTAYMELVDRFDRAVEEVRQLMPEIVNENGPNCTPKGCELRAI